MIDNYDVREAFLEHLKKMYSFYVDRGESVKVSQKVAVVDDNYPGYALIFDTDLSMAGLIRSALSNQVVSYVTIREIKEDFPLSLQTLFSELSGLLSPNHNQIWVSYSHAIKNEKLKLEGFTTKESGFRTVYFSGPILGICLHSGLIF